jgi:hypothetical protein
VEDNQNRTGLADLFGLDPEGKASMKNRITLGLVLGGLGLVVAVSSLLFLSHAALTQARYPNSGLVIREKMDWGALTHGTLSRQVEYQTADDLAAVQRWYADYLRVSPASELYTGGECRWLTQSKLIARLNHTLSVLLCVEGTGTRIVLTESAYMLWP